MVLRTRSASVLVDKNGVHPSLISKTQARFGLPPGEGLIENPPASNRGVSPQLANVTLPLYDWVNAMTLEFSIDWQNWTNTNDGNRSPTDTPYPLTNTWQIAGAGRGYNAALSNEEGMRLSWHTDRDDMGVHAQYSGQALRNCAAQGVTAKAIATHHHSKKHRCSRVDLAIDTKNEGMSIRTLANYTRKHVAALHVKSFSHIKSHDGGETLYLGSRTSELFMRIYNKAAEQGNKPENPADWVRIEIECKGTRAAQLGVIIANQSEAEVAKLTRGMAKDMADFPHKPWQIAVGDTPIHIAGSQVKSSKTRAWLLETIAPCLANYMNDNDDLAFLSEFLDIVNSYTKKPIDKP